MIVKKSRNQFKMCSKW